MSSALAPAWLDQARERVRDHGGRMVDAVREVTGWSEAETAQALGDLFAYPILDAAALQTVAPRFDLVSFAESNERLVLVVEHAAGALALLTSDPFDNRSLDWARRRAHLVGHLCDVLLTDLGSLKDLLARCEANLRAIDGDAAAIAESSEGDVAATLSLAGIASLDSPVVRLVNSALHDALQLGASDIHWESDPASLRVSCRIDGVLVPLTQIPGRELAEQVISRIKVMAELDIAERRIPQDGRFKVRAGEREVDLRVSVMPSLFGEDAVLRLLDRRALADEAASLSLGDLGMGDDAIVSIRRLARQPHGMVLVTGPTGSGKTTTLYAAITEIHTGRDKIITIEDPVEYRLPRVLQIPVNEKKGLTFARGLRSILRHDPDKIMVGEIRDGETAQIAVQAALTGHLVFTTVHANSVFDVLGRFLHMGVEPYSLAAALRGIVSQRLLRTVCAKCSREHVADDGELALAGLRREQVEGWRLRRGVGCANCRGTGYKGRMAVAEVLALDDTCRELIAARAPVLQLKEHAKRLGLVALQEAAFACVARGDTTLEEVERVAG